MKLDYTLLYKLFCSCYKNGFDLLVEAKLLYENERYTRAYTLAHLSFEELGKLPMINTYMYKVVHGSQYDVQHLMKRMRDHKEKIQVSHFTSDLFSNEDIDLTDNRKLNQYINEMNNMKNNSIYVGLNNGTISIPNDVVTKQKAEKMIEMSTMHATFHSHFSQLSEEELKKLHSDDLYKLLIR
ncbi:AbiV family abortive infection protein [Lysinibacillus sp. ZYM-1]|uniref:AbiV family abortive infection protein n=1 Tax=Lysinibacillus sp. ZYM-1 TaxID=1681184 RepID=UPI0018D148D3|nr:AbiV family abortive infection protein [Lysinibacillus sp. ZYM-1]